MSKWQITSVFCVSLFFGWGYQSGQVKNATASVSPIIQVSQSLLCEDGTPIKAKLAVHQWQGLERLTEFGDQARVLWKSCVCSQSESFECTALEVEIFEHVQLSQAEIN